MSEEMKEAMQAEETSQVQTEETAEAETTETMADYEDHFDDANPWNRVAEYMEKKTVLPVKVEGVVNGGVIAMVEGLRGFVPASKLSLSYIEDLETYLLKDIEVQVIDVDQANNRLVLSAREILKEKEKKAREEQIANLKVGTVLEGTVETLQNYGAFVKLENGLSGLVHVSQISQKRVKVPSDVLNVGDNVTVKSGVQLWDGARIEDNAFIGPNVTFTNDLVPRSKVYPERFLITTIKNGASIGANSTIVAGHTIGEHAFVGAGSVVTKDIPANTVWYGNPARQKGYITDDGILLDMEYRDKTGKKYELI